MALLRQKDFDTSILSQECSHLLLLLLRRGSAEEQELLVRMDTPKARIIDLLQERDIDPADRRRARRYACRLEGTLQTAQDAVPCEIQSMSSGGISVACSCKLRQADVVTVSIPKQQAGVDMSPQEFTVRRASSANNPGGTVHLALNGSPSEKSWFLQELRELEARAEETRQRREGIRVACRLAGHLHHNGQQYPVTIVDLGTAGARLKTSELPPTSKELTLSFGPTHNLPEIVVTAIPAGQSDEGQLGISFLEFSAGSSKEVRDYMRYCFTTRRAV